MSRHGDSRLDKQISDYFCELLDFAMPWDGGVAVLLVAYFDASAREKSDMYAVAGLAFDADMAKKATKEWVDLWGDTRCHMTDLHSGRSRPGNPYFGWTDDAAGKRLKDSVSIINSHASYAVAVSCRISDIERLAPKVAAPGSEFFLDAFSAAYPLCSTMAMSALGGLLRKGGRDSDVAYFFEQGDLNQSAAQRYIKNATSPEHGDDRAAIKEHYRHRSFTVMQKEDSRLFEMADIFAWEWAKHMERLMQGKPMRGSLRALLGDGEHGETDFKSASRRAFHNAGPSFAAYLRDIKEQVLS